jgi:hypothetical protein
VAEKGSMKVYPVINGLETKPFNSIKRAFECNVDGVYITNIGHVGDNKEFLDVFDSVRDEFHDDEYFGINLRGYSSDYAIRTVTRTLPSDEFLLYRPQSLWVDDLREGIDVELATGIRDEGIRLIGGVAIGLCTCESIKAALERTNTDIVDCILTDVENLIDRKAVMDKLCMMKEIVENRPMAVVGESTINDVLQYKGIVDELLLTNIFSDKPGRGIYSYDFLRRLVYLAHEN